MKTRTTFEVMIENGCEPEPSAPFGTTLITVTVGGVSKSRLCAPDSYSRGFVINTLYEAACIEFTALQLAAN